jgi:hypothetical protein
MKKLITILGITVIGIIAILVTLHSFNTRPVAARAVKVVITGPDGQRFSGNYIADGVTNSVSAIAPATISFQARDVDFAFTRDGGDGEFRVALYVGDLCRTSTTSDKQPGVRGQLRYTSTSESYWAAGF